MGDRSVLSERWAAKLGLCVFALHAALAHAQALIKIQYNERPPYQVTAADGTVSGLTATPVARALREAGVPHEWEKIPINRQMSAIRAGTESVCGVGWFMNPERQQFARFTRPIYTDHRGVLLAHASAQFGRDAGIEEVLSQRGIRVLVKESYSYGPFLDGLLTKLSPTLVSTTGENGQMAGMVALGRADVMFISEEEAPVALADVVKGREDVRIVRPAGMPAGERRYLMCSQAVSEDTIRRINQALPARP
jgi:hypothetical protein